MDLRYMDSNNIIQKPEPKQLIMAYDYAREVSALPTVTLKWAGNVFNALETGFLFT